MFQSSPDASNTLWHPSNAKLFFDGRRQRSSPLPTLAALLSIPRALSFFNERRDRNVPLDENAEWISKILPPY